MYEFGLIKKALMVVELVHAAPQLHGIFLQGNLPLMDTLLELVEAKPMEYRDLVA